MLKIIIFIVCGFVLFKLFMGDKKKKEEIREKETATQAAAGEMVKDPICGAYVAKDADIRVKQGDHVHCFCSYECRDKFIKQLSDGKEKESA